MAELLLVDYSLTLHKSIVERRPRVVDALFSAEVEFGDVAMRDLDQVVAEFRLHRPVDLVERVRRSIGLALQRLDLGSIRHRSQRPAQKKKEDKGFFGNFDAQIAENAGGVKDTREKDQWGNPISGMTVIDQAVITSEQKAVLASMASS